MINADVVIFGGGIAGLWTLASLTQQGYNVILLETDAFGSGQTIKSQGIIHAGLKYALTGKISSDVSSLKDMPTIWQACLNGTGSIDLSKAKILAQYQYLWSTNKLAGNLATLFTSNALASYIEATPQDSWPPIIIESSIKTKLYKLAELVLDIPSVLQTLATPHLNRCIKIDQNDGYTLETDANNNISSITIRANNSSIKISAQKYIFTTGSNNVNFTQKLHLDIDMQLRPLHMVLVKSNNLLPLYGHCIGLSTTPRITVTTHFMQDGTPVWYLGGKIAEDGVTRTTTEQITEAKKELQTLFPNLKLNDAQYATFFVDRAEAKQQNGNKPDTATVFSNNNYITAWPTKLALAPVLAKQILQHFDKDNISPIYTEFNNLVAALPHPKIAIPIWDKLL